VSGGLKSVGALDARLVPDAPRANLTADEAVRGWQIDRERRLRTAAELADVRARLQRATEETRHIHERYQHAEADITTQRDSALAEAQATRERAIAAEFRAEMARVQAQEGERERAEVEERLQAAQGALNRFRRALDIAITWLYRRQNWSGLSSDTRNKEPGPADMWGTTKYSELGLDEFPFEPPKAVIAEPGWQPPLTERQDPEVDHAIQRLARAIMPPPPPRPDRPPLAAGIPDAAWEMSRAEFCLLMRDLIAGGDALAERLHRLPTTATRIEAADQRVSIESWMAEFVKFTDAYFGPLSDTQFARGERALKPEWRQKRVEMVTSRVGWLRSLPAQYSCE
jgi:hypothetical protein